LSSEARMASSLSLPAGIASRRRLALFWRRDNSLALLLGVPLPCISSGRPGAFRSLRKPLEPMNTTLPSLLERLRQPVDQEAWERFVHLYTPLLCRWARKVGAPALEVGDVVQDVFAVLVHKLPDFQYDPSQRFRGWLWTITVNKWRERCRKQQPELQAD